MSVIESDSVKTNFKLFKDTKIAPSTNISAKKLLRCEYFI